METCVHALQEQATYLIRRDTGEEKMTMNEHSLL